jgi:hypothetical protein
LYRYSADVNLLDRWQSTAFQDALSSGHISVAVMLHAAGGHLGPLGDQALLTKLEAAPKVGLCTLNQVDP